MRVLSVILWVLAALALVLWAIFYIWAFGMACAFVTSATPGSCGPKPPWTLRGEDLLYLVILPGLVVGALVAGAWAAGRASR
jgi:hypothetical protein